MQNIEELKIELSAPIKSIRIFAIENALRTGFTQELLDCLQEVLPQEKDPECRLLLEHAVSKLSDKLQKKETTANIENLQEAFKNVDAKIQLAQINSIKVTQLRNLDMNAVLPALLESSKDDVVTAEIVKKFRKYWPEAQVEFLEKNAFSSAKSLQIACIETLVKNFPAILKAKLPKLVFINDPVIRSLSIRGMAKHFPQLAADFIKACFEKGDYYNKVTALKICSTLDFSLIKNSLLLLMYNDPEMKIFELVCTILLANPDKEVPFRLVAMIPKTTKEKAEQLKKFIPQYCKAIEISGICENYKAFITYLQDYPKILSARQFVNNILLSYSQEDDEIRVELLKQLHAQLKNNFVKDAISESIEKVKNPELKQKLEALLSGDAASKEESQTPAPQADLNNEASLIKEFTRARFKKSSGASDKVKKVLEMNSNVSENLLAAALKAALVLKISDYVQFAKSSLKTKNEKLLVASLEYLAVFDKDEFQILMQKFVNTETQLVRVCLIRITGQEFPDYAKFLVKHMLESSDPNIRRNGLEAAIHIDFFTLSPILTEFLEKEEIPDLIEDGLSIILANPTIESINNLKHLGKVNYTNLSAFEKAKRNLTSFLIENGMATKEEIDFFIQVKASEAEKKQEESNKKNEQEQQLSDLKDALNWDSISDSLSDSIDELKKLNWRRNLMIFAGLFLLLNVLYYALFRETPDPGANDVALKPVLAKITTYEGKVEKLFPKTKAALVKTLSTPEEQLIISPPAGTSFNLKVGDNLSLIGRPYKRNIEGQIFVEVKGITKKTKSK